MTTHIQPQYSEHVSKYQRRLARLTRCDKCFNDFYDLRTLQGFVDGYFQSQKLVYLKTCMKNGLVTKVLAEVVRLSKCVNMALTVQMNTGCAVVSQTKKQKSNILNNFLVVFCPFAGNSACFYIIHVFHGCCISNQEFKKYISLNCGYFSRITNGICDAFPDLRIDVHYERGNLDFVFFMLFSE